MSNQNFCLLTSHPEKLILGTCHACRIKAVAVIKAIGIIVVEMVRASGVKQRKTFKTTTATV